MTNPDGASVPDYYALLSVSTSATVAELKEAYRRVLLISHPDKHASKHSSDSVDIDLLKRAFLTLSTPDLRKAYDLMRAGDTQRTGPRPAQVISLEDFDEDSDSRWTYPCRCGGAYVITQDMLEAGQHLVGCASCSEVVWAGYEVVEEAEDENP